MKISACVIVKNEAANLPQWLDCVKRLADEIVVVDTGSTDETVEVARAAGAKLCHFDWIKDFAAAKNYALDQATGEWIVFLDADEYFPPEDCPRVLSLIRRYHPDRRVAGFLCRRIDIDPEHDNKYIDDVTVLRVFRNSRFLRFEGKVHEVVKCYNKRPPQMKFAKEIKIFHTGYASSRIGSKVRRNLEILLSERKRRGELPEDSFYLADCYIALDDYEKAAYYAQKTIDDNIRLLGLSNRPHLLLIHCLMLLKRPADEVKAAIAKARERFPGMPEFPMIAGVFAWRNQRYYEAEQELRRGMALYEKFQEDLLKDPYAGDQATGILPSALWHLGKLAAMRGDASAARQYIREGLSLNRKDGGLLAQAAQLLEDMPPVEAIEWLNPIYDQPTDAGMLARKLASTRLALPCLYYERRSGEVIFSDFDRYRLASRGAAAAGCAIDAADALIRLARLAIEKTPAAGGNLQLLLPPIPAAMAPVESRRAKRLREAIE